MLLTNGAAEAFTLIARALRPRLAVCVHPSFTAPEAALRDAGHEVARVLLAPPFALAPDDVPADADLVVVGNPTNPTGRLHPAAVLERLARPGRVLVVDEAFADAVPGEPASLASRRDLPGVLVVRSLTKAWGLAGLRVGYVLGEPALLAALAQAQPPWPVSSLALTALECCSTPEAVAWVERQAATAAGWRQALAAALDALPGVEVAAGGQAPFLLVRVADGAAARLRLRDLGIAVRRGDTFPGLGDQWLRIAVVSPEHHARIVDAFARSTTPGAAPSARPGAAPSTGPVGVSTTVTAAAQAGTGDSGGARAGSVTLIGAGPGGADLITMRGWRALHAADVVVADRLADPRLTSELRPGVVLIDAGKAPGAPQLSQDEISQVLVAHARAGHRVARLKGGDPFVFGRGGEEAAACAAAGHRLLGHPGPVQRHRSARPGRHPADAPPGQHVVLGRIRAPAAGSPGQPGGLGRTRGRHRHAGAADGSAEPACHRGPAAGPGPAGGHAGRLHRGGGHRPPAGAPQHAGGPGPAGPGDPPVRNPAVIVIGPTAGDLSLGLALDAPQA